MSPISPFPRDRRRRSRRSAALAAAFVALLGVLVLVPAPSFALEPASRLDPAPLTLSPQPPDPTAAAPSAGTAGSTTTSTTSPALGTTPGSGSTTTTTPGPVTASSPEALSRLASAPGRQRAHAEGVAAFRLIAVKLHTTSTDPVLVRVHDANGWGAWQSLGTDGADAPDAGTAEAIRGDQRADGAKFSEPVWVGTADGYEVSLPADATDATADLVRDTTRVVRTNGDRANAAVVPTGGQPPINTRASWSARPPVDPPSISSTVRMAIVHHSVTANDYAPGDVPGILRSIQTFHMDGRGWNDIAYNFAVDKYGTMWEARGGGITNAVMGGHAMGANHETTGVVTLGDFTAAAAPQAMVHSIAQLIGWKLYIHGTDPNGSNIYTLDVNTKYPTGTVLNLPNIIGHRDVGATGCPGDQLYPLLGQIRSEAGAKWQQQRSTPGFWPGVVVGANADGRLQAFAVSNDQQIQTRWQLAGGGWSGWAALGGLVSGRLTVTPNADGRLQVFGIGVDGTLQSSWQTAPNGGWSGVASMGGRWSATAGVGVGRDTDGRLEAFVLGDDNQISNTWQRTPNGRWDGYAAIGGGFPSYANITTGTNLDGRLEIFAIGDGPTLVHTWQKPSGGWAPFTPIGGPVIGELAVANDADGRLEVVGTGADGRLWDAWQLTPNGPWSGPAILAGGLRPGSASTLARDSDGRLEFFGLSPAGALLNIWQSSPNGNWVGPASMGGSWVGTPAVLVSADHRLTAVAFGAPDATRLSVNAQSTAGGVFSGWTTLP